MGTTAVQTAAETRELCSPVDGSTFQPNQQPIPNFAIAGELLAEFQSTHNKLETKASSAKELIENEVYPLLVRMQAILSQRGAEHLRLEARLPTWTEYYEAFRLKFKLPSLRMFQRRKLALTGSSAQGKSRSSPKKGPRFTTGMGDAAGYRLMITDLLRQIEKQADDPQAIRRTVAEYRKILSAEIVPRATVPKSIKPEQSKREQQTEDPGPTFQGTIGEEDVRRILRLARKRKGPA